MATELRSRESEQKTYVYEKMPITESDIKRLERPITSDKQYRDTVRFYNGLMKRIAKDPSMGNRENIRVYSAAQPLRRYIPSHDGPSLKIHDFHFYAKKAAKAAKKETSTRINKGKCARLKQGYILHKGRYYKPKTTEVKKKVVTYKTVPKTVLGKPVPVSEACYTKQKKNK